MDVGGVCVKVYVDTWSNVTGNPELEREVTALRSDVWQVRVQQEELGERVSQDMAAIKQLLHQITAFQQHSSAAGQDGKCTCTLQLEYVC